MNNELHQNYNRTILRGKWKASMSFGGEEVVKDS